MTTNVTTTAMPNISSNTTMTTTMPCNVSSPSAACESGEETMHKCHCAKDWSYKDQMYHECSNTVDSAKRWCKIVDGPTCEKAQQLPDGVYFDNCWEVVTGEETENGCNCKSEWNYANKTRRTCISTTGHPKAWCEVMAGCAGAKEAGKDRGEWDSCKEKKKKPEEPGENVTWENEEQGEETIHKCHCKLQWEHLEKAYSNCANTPDHNSSWCEVGDGPTCPGSHKRPEDGVYWDECMTWEEESTKGVGTKHDCHCKLSWVHNNTVQSNCLRKKSDDHPEPWCEVVPGCPGAHKQNGTSDWDECKEEDEDWEEEEGGGKEEGEKEEEEKGGEKTNKTKEEGEEEEEEKEEGDETDHGCHCKPDWVYHGIPMSNCAVTADAKKPWCFVVEPDACEGGKPSSSNPGEVWDTCPYGVETSHKCHCKLSWEYGGIEHSNCVHTKDNKEPWCYVMDGDVCPGAIKTHKQGQYWDVCEAATPPTTLPPPVGEETLHDCHCLTTWTYGGQTFHNCEKTVGMDEEWCYVSDGLECPGSKKGATGQYWDVCEEPKKGVETLHNCNCKLSWVYQGEVRSNCLKSEDHNVPWCYVDPGCRSAKKGKADWDDCKPETESSAMESPMGVETVEKCHCKFKWEYHGNLHNNCEATADSKRPWCFVMDADVCENGHVSETGEIYDFCPLGQETVHECHCHLLWEYGGHSHSNCIHTSDNKEPWCYVTDGDSCPGAIKTSRTGKYWDTCLHAATTTTTAVPLGEETLHQCHCRPTWTYGGNTHHNCDMTEDNNVPWCYIGEGPSCEGAKKGSTGEYWDVCQRGGRGVETLHKCRCKLDWIYQGTKRSNCIVSADHPREWCYVESGCDGAFKGKEPWDECLPAPAQEPLGEETVQGCHCLRKWDYHDVQHHNCAWTADNTKPWCFTSEGLDCQGGTVSTSMREMVWDFCPIGVETTHHCHCKLHWEYGGLTHSNCVHTKDNKDPWCYVSEDDCAGAIRTHRTGDYWDTCIPDEDDHEEVMHDEVLLGEVTFHNCHCEPKWEYNGKAMENCAWLDNAKEPWCYIVDGKQCTEAKASKDGTKFWDKCRVGPETVKGCHCKGRWEHQGKTMYGCTKTADRTEPWCYIGDVDQCKDAQDGEFGKWDRCIMEGELTTHECHCEKTWEYQGQTYENCHQTEDSKTRWCYVADGQFCHGAQTNAQGRQWDTCPVLGEETKNGCHCLQKWTYMEQELSNCYLSADHDKPWCFVSEGSKCQGGQLSTETGQTWDECPLGVETRHGCHCNMHWKYGGLWHKNCIITKGTDHPWCYVSDWATCKGAIRTSKGGKYWDKCFDDAEVE